MADINTVTLVGRLTRDVELKYTSGGFAIAALSLAQNQRRKKGEHWEDEAHFFDCKMLGKRAESVAQYLTKGKQVAIRGTLQQERWEKDGQKRSKVVVLVDDLQLLGGGEQAKSQPQQDQGGFDDDVPW
jgi:single-strand DNA-binding protein